MRGSVPRAEKRSTARAEFAKLPAGVNVFKHADE
jgi:hypothetical protein